jgi:hypothetical protein
MITTGSWLMASFILWLGLSPSRSQVVDCVVAEVNGKAITLTDIRILREFAILPDAGSAASPGTLRQVLEEAIDRRVVIDLVREDIEVSAEEADEFLSHLKRRLGAGRWQAALARFGLPEEGLRLYVDDLIRYVKTIDLRFGPKVEIEPQAIERYYDEVYAPFERESGREPKALSEARAEIEVWIRSTKSRELAAVWVRSLRGQADVRIHEACLEKAS